MGRVCNTRGDKLTWGHGDKGERQRGRGPKIQGMQIDAEAERQGDKIPSQKFRVGWDRREFKSVNYNY